MIVPIPRRLASSVAALFFVASLILLASCIHHGHAAIVAYMEQQKLFVRGDCPQSSETCAPFKPIEADRYASEQYDHYRESGFVTLQPDMRLRVVAPIMRRGGSGTPLIAEDSANSDSASSNIDVSAGGALVGYETAVYDLIPGSAGALSVQLEKMEVKPVANAAPASVERRDLLEVLPKDMWLRLYFQLRRSVKDHETYLLMAKSLGRLNEASGEFEEDPDAFCAAPHNDAHCLAFPKFTAVTAEVKVHVQKRDVYVPISATLRDAIAAYGEADPKSVAPDVKVRRRWNSRLVPVEFDTKPARALSLQVVAGDRITW
jgi:hypothetical protein